MHHHEFTRRDFLKAGTVGAGAFLLAGPSLADEAKDPYGSFKVGLQSYSLRGFDVKTALGHTRRLGLRYWEAFPGHIRLSTIPSHVEQHKALLDEHDVTLLAYGVIGFDANETKAREAFDFAKAMGIVSISADPQKNNETFDLLDKLVAEYDIAIAIHNHGPGHRYDKISDALEMVKDRHPKIGACVDTGHYLRSDENPVEAIERFGKRTFGVHFKDYRTVADGDRRRKQETILGEGELDVPGCLKALRKLDYQYSLSLEYEQNPDNPLADIETGLKNVREAVAKLG